ncbi:hypothetical protein ACQY0O_004954 [Thecaphora frezii]
MPSVESSAAMAMQPPPPPPPPPPRGPATTEQHPSSFLANHHRLHNPDDPKLRATAAATAKSKRSSLFGAIIKSKPKNTSKLGRQVPTASGDVVDVATDGSGNGGSFGAAASSWSSRGRDGSMAAPRERTSSRSRRHSLGAILSRSTADLQAEAQRQEMPELPQRFASQPGRMQTPRALPHDKVLSNDSRPPSDLIGEDVHPGPVGGDFAAPALDGTRSKRDAPVRSALAPATTAIEAPSLESEAPYRFRSAAATDPAATRTGAALGAPARRILIRSQSAMTELQRVDPWTSVAVAPAGHASPLAVGADVSASLQSAAAPASPSPHLAPNAHHFAVPARLASRPETDSGSPEAARSPQMGWRAPAIQSPRVSNGLVPLATAAAPPSPSTPSGPVSIRSLRASFSPQSAAASRMAELSKSVTPRSAGSPSKGAIGDETHGNEDEGKDDGDEDTDLVPRRRKRAAMSMMDFLSSESPSAENASAPASPFSAPTARSERAAATSKPAAAPVPASIPLLAAARSSMLPSSRTPASAFIDMRRRSSGNVVLPSQYTEPSSQPRPPRRASVVASPVSPVTQGLDSEQGMPTSLSISSLARPDGAAVVEAGMDAQQRWSSNRSREEGPLQARRLDDSLAEATGDVAARFAQGPQHAAYGASPRPPVALDIGGGMSLSVEPMADDIVMFGSTQTSSNYSLSGAVVLTLPRLRPVSQRHDGEMGSAPSASSALARAASIHDPASPTKTRHAQNVHRHTASMAEPRSTGRSHSGLFPSALDRPFGAKPVAPPDGPDLAPEVPLESGAAEQMASATAAEPPAVRVESLTVTFSGFAMYVDTSGRFNAIKLASVSQELLQSGGCTCYAVLNERTASDAGLPASGSHQPDASAATVASQPLKYDIEFDLSVPGWLPGSLRSRFGGTFYCLQATAIVDGRQITSTSSPNCGWELPSPTAMRVAVPHFSDPFAAGSQTGQGNGGDATDEQSSPWPLAANDPASATRSPADPEGGGVANAKSDRPKSSWLGKRARQLQLRTPKRSAGGAAEAAAAGADDLGSGRRKPETGSQAELLAMEENGFGQALNQPLADGRRKLQSNAVTIVVRRCRDVVPVPVARMALISSDRNLPGLNIPPVTAAPTQRPTSATAEGDGGHRTPEASLVQSQTMDSFVTAVAGTPVVTPSPSGALPVSAPSAAPPLAALASRPEPRAPALAADIGRDDGVPQSAAPSADPVASGPSGPLRSNDEGSAMFPPAPSAFDLPSDPSKRAAAAAALASSTPTPPTPTGVPRSATMTSMASDVGNARSPPRTSSRGTGPPRSSAPMRHFLHRPVLYPPAELGIFGSEGGGASEGLPFSLTLSLPSHVQVSGPKSDTLSFGVQIEVGKSDGWNAVRQLGGLRLRDMELVCLQMERHSSVPSRTFCTTFPVPAPPNRIQPTEIPSVVPSSKRAAQLALMSSTEARLRYGYDRNMVLNHLGLLRRGEAPDPLENNVERTRTTIVGPPPSAPSNPENSAAGGNKGFGRKPNGGKAKDKSKGKGKDKDKGKGKDRRADHEFDASDPSVGPSQPIAGPSALPTEAGRAARAETSSSSLRARFASGVTARGLEEGGLAPPTADQDRTASSASPSPRTSHRALAAAGSVGGTATPPMCPPAQRMTSSALGGFVPASGTSRFQAPQDAPDGAGATSDAQAQGGARGPSRRRRVYESALSRLSNFASSMLDPGLDAEPGSNHPDMRGVNGSSHSMGDQGMSEDTSARATYIFSGEDGDGVDLTRGRVRMTINLPLASANAAVARSKGSAQLIPDFESPYVRIRHKLKVKLGFGLSHQAQLEEHAWSQALVMCVPVRFTESPPKEVQDQFAPITVVPLRPSRGGAASDPAPLSAASYVAAPTPSGSASAQAEGGVPLLPAYTQLFREDGSRLADEGEDLPQYPGRMSVVGEIDLDDSDGGRPGAVVQARSTASARSGGDAPRSNGSQTNEGAVRPSTALRCPGQVRSADVRREVSAPSELDDPAAQGVSASISYASMFADAMERGSSLGVPAVMDRSTSLPGKRGTLRGTASLTPLKSSTSSSFLGPQTAPSGSFSVNRPPMRQRSATYASPVTFSRIAPSEVMDEALLSNTMEDEEARRDAARAAAQVLNDEEDDDDDDDDDDEATVDRDVDALSMTEGLTDAETSDDHAGSSRSSGEQPQPSHVPGEADVGDATFRVDPPTEP